MRRKLLSSFLFLIVSFSSFGQFRNAFRNNNQSDRQIWTIQCQNNPEDVLSSIYGDFSSFLTNPRRPNLLDRYTMNVDDFLGRSREETQSTSQSTPNRPTRFVVESFSQLSQLLSATGDPSSPLACRPGQTIEVEIVDPVELRISRYEQSDEVAAMIQVLRANAGHTLRRVGANGARARRTRRKRSSQPTGFCYRYVKFGLKQGGLTRATRRDPGGYLTGGRARDAGPALERQGFVNMMQEPFNITSIADAPKGAVLVYTGGASGHIEVKAGDNEFISDFVDNQPISHRSNLGSARRLTGIYIK